MVGAAAWPLGALVGVAWALWAPEPASAGVGMAFAALGLALGVWARRQRPAAAAVLVLLATGLMSQAWTDARVRARLGLALDPALEGLDLVVQGRVDDLPQPGPDGLRFTLAPEQGWRDGRSVALPPRISLSWPRPEAWPDAVMPALRAGERWRLPVRLRRFHAPHNPHGHDLELWAFEQSLGAAGAVRPGVAGEAQRLGPPRPWWPPEALPAWRQALRDRVLLALPDVRVAGLLAALAVGDQGAIPATDWELFQQTGVAHLMSISGLHITLFAALAAAAIGTLWRSWPAALRRVPAPSAARWGGVALATGYALLSGWGLPAQRTVLMLALGALATSGGWRWPPTLVCLWSAALLVLADPWALLQPGFWLSCAAVWLLLSVGGPAEPAAPGWRARAVALLRQGARTQWLATVGLAPLAMLWFGQFVPLGLVANAVAVPLVTWGVTPLALLGLLWTPVLAVAGALAVPLLWGLQALDAWSPHPWSVPAAPPWAGAGALLGAWLLVARLPWWVRLLGPLLAAPLLWPALPRPDEGRFSLLAADVGQGSAVLLRTRHHTLLFDAGPATPGAGDAGARLLWPLLRASGERRLDLLVLSHRDLDHVGGAASLLARLPVAQLRHSLEPGHPLLARGVPSTPCQAGQRWDWDGVRFELIHPFQPGAGAPGQTNAASCVLRVQDARGRVALMTGDIGTEQEAALLARGPGPLRADLLVVAHHGSRSSSSSAFLQAVRPEWAVVQAGYRNRFGHPHPEVLARLGALGSKVVRTDRCGAWEWTEAGATCTREVQPRHWRDRPPPEPAAQAGSVVAMPRAGEPR